MCYSICLCLSTIVLTFFLTKGGIVGFIVILSEWIISYIISWYILTTEEVIDRLEIGERMIYFGFAPFVFWITIIVFIYAMYAKAAWERNRK